MALRTRHALAALAAASTVAVVGVAAPAPAVPASPDGLTLISVRHSLLGTHEWYQQTYLGIPVLGGYYGKHTNSRTGAVLVQDGRRAVTGVPAKKAVVTADRALAAATARSGGNADSATLVYVPGARAVLAWRVLNDTARGTVASIVDAGNGAVLRAESLVKEVTGSGQVFDPNPVASLQNQFLVDNKDRDYATLAGAYRTVPLTQLDGTRKLHGAYAQNTSDSQVVSKTHEFIFDRSQRGFEQVMGYYHLTQAQEYIHSLGFTDANNSSQKYRTTGFSGDNSFYDPSRDRITFGTGGVDDAEDAEVIWHEYGHAIQDDQVPGFGTTLESGSIGEGFGDYWAFTMSVPVSQDTATTPQACIADWDSISYTSGTPHCLRRTDGDKVYPDDVRGEVHADGEIWSRALWDIHRALGRNRADTVILEAQFSFAPDTTFAAAAVQTVAAADALYGAPAAALCQQMFEARGIL